MSTDNKVLVMTLWQRTSERGNEYLSGYLGKARVIGFRGEPTADGTPTWNVYLAPGREQQEGAGSRAARSSQQQPSTPWQTPPPTPTSDPCPAPPPGRVERCRQQQSEQPPSDRQPWDDDISGIGR
jgi:hypothetical protein